MNSRSYKIEANSCFYSLDLRDRLGLIICICERFRIHAKMVELAININRLEENVLFSLMGFTIVPEKNPPYLHSNLVLELYSVCDAIKEGELVIAPESGSEEFVWSVTQKGNEFWLETAHPLGLKNSERLRVPFFYKAIEKTSRGISNGDLQDSENRFCYISGYQESRPELAAVLIGPKWHWMLETDVALSGVNFLDQENDLYKSKERTLDKYYRCIYVGSSSLNKLAPVALFIIALSRIGLNKKIKPDVFICYRFLGVKGRLIWSVTKFLVILIKFLRFEITFLLSDKKLDKSFVIQHIEKSMYGLVPYLREGFPRVIGDYALSDCEPLVLSWMKYGGGEFSGYSKSFLSVLSALKGSKCSKEASKFTKNLPLNFFRPEKRVNKILLEDSRFALFSEQISYVNSEIRYILLYTFLTKDLTLANNWAPDNAQ